MEFQTEFEQDGGGALDKHHVNIRCFAAWEFESGKFDGGRPVNRKPRYRIEISTPVVILKLCPRPRTESPPSCTMAFSLSAIPLTCSRAGGLVRSVPVAMKSSDVLR